MSVSHESRPPNRLIHETSPYLLQHAHNPVDWYPWGSEALERARREDKPILLSIGYAACHWCHVMERESFENAEIARLMNENFVCIKVDREERPDLDEIYMAATVAMSGSGGWPMTVFLDARPAAVLRRHLFPARPTSTAGPGFGTLLDARSPRSGRSERDALLDAGGRAHRARARQSSAAERAELDRRRCDRARRAPARARASIRAGAASAARPKFPPERLALAAACAITDATSDAQRARDGDAARSTRMKNGGMYDHARRRVRALLDRRALARAALREDAVRQRAARARYLEAYQVTRNDEYRRVARETLDYVLREMQAPEGGYYSATDADSEGEEGKFFVWTPDEIDEVLERRRGRALLPLLRRHATRAIGRARAFSTRRGRSPKSRAAARHRARPSSCESLEARSRRSSTKRASSACRRCSTTRCSSPGTG